MIASTTKTNISNHDKVHKVLENKVELNDFLEPSQAATQKIDPFAEENTDNLLNSLTKNIKISKYFNLAKTKLI